jgi:SAM-dependent methyltransferase
VTPADHLTLVARYYDYTVPYYRIFWHGRTAGLHYGLAEPWTRSAADELIGTNQFLASVSRVDAHCDVLDAGCGVGGSAVWLASHLGAHVTGVTLSHRQARHARRLAEHRAVADRVRFFVGDYERLALPEAHFDVVWAIESACYAEDKRRFIAAAIRLLRPGGRLVVADGFLLRMATDLEAQLLTTFLEGLALPNLAHADDFDSALRESGFSRVERFDKTAAATPSAQRLRRRCAAGLLPSRIGEAVGWLPPLLTRNIRAGIVQLDLVERGLVGYQVFCATKPGLVAGLVAENTR